MGFTLLEVIVAVAILAVASAALLQIFSSGLRGARTAEHHTMAMLLAESKLAAVGVEAPLDEGETRGEFDNGYRWLATVRPYREPGREEDAEGPVVAYRVAVTVSWDEGRGTGSVSLVTLRLASAR